MKKDRLFILPVFAALALSLADARAATLFPVVVGDRWGFADKSGNVVINPQFERAEPFASGLAEVR
ncbi:MAG: WG repeat-containing protein, partial [Limisphaerales bacterium]